MYTVYRIEKNSIGPYSGRELDSRLDRILCTFCYTSDRHPTPSKDIQDWNKVSVCGKYSMASWVFGFQTMRDLYRWFPPAVRRILHEEGFIICVYSVETSEGILIGKRQCAFHKEEVELVDIMSVYDGDYE